MVDMQVVNPYQKVFIENNNVRYSGEISTPNPTEFDTEPDKGGSGDTMIIPSDSNGTADWVVGGCFPEETKWLCKLHDQQKEDLGRTYSCVIGDFNSGYVITADIIITNVGVNGTGSSDLEFKATNIKREYGEDMNLIL